MASGSLPLPRRFARYARSSTCGERCHLSHVVSDSVALLFENAFCKPSRAAERDFLVSAMVGYVLALKTCSEAPRRTKRGLNARQGMEGAKTRYRRSQEVRRADTPNQGLSGRQEPRQPPAKPICTAQAAKRLVGGRRPSVLPRWGSGVLPRRFPVALKALPEPWQIRRFGDHRAKVADGVNDVILRHLPYPNRIELTCCKRAMQVRP